MSDPPLELPDDAPELPDSDEVPVEGPQLDPAGADDGELPNVPAHVDTMVPPEPKEA